MPHRFKDGAPDRNRGIVSLTELLGQSEHANELLNQSSSELSSATTSFGQGCGDGAIEALDIVSGKLQQASERLTAVNRLLKEEIRERILINHQLAAAIEQEGGARNAAFHDPLTGLPNRALFDDRLEQGIAQAKRHQWTLAVMFVDLDSFKSINDTYGHHAGDAVLQLIAKRLKEISRDEDTVSRDGGDEFLYLLTQIHEQKDIAALAVKILETIQAPCNVGTGEAMFNRSIEASIGIAIFPRDGDTAQALIDSADDAMYRAKQKKAGYAFAQ